MIVRSDNMVLKPVKSEVVSYGDIAVPTGAYKQNMMWGEVVAVGEGNRGYYSHKLWPVHVRRGDRVLYPQGAIRGAFRNVVLEEQHYEEVIFVQERDAKVYIRDGEIVPLYDTLIGKQIKESEFEVLSSGLYIPRGTEEDDTKNYCRVEIEKVGFGYVNDVGEVTSCSSKPGCVAYINKWDLWEYQIGSDLKDTYVVMDEDDLLCITEE